MNSPASPQKTRIAVLDGLRGLAIVLVLVHHFIDPLFSQVPGTLSAYGHPVFHLAFAGVDLFFVLSGFFIGGNLFDHHAAPNLYRVFYFRRGLRILPLAFLFIGIVFCFWSSGIYRDQTLDRPDHPLVYLTFTSNIVSAVKNNWGFGPLAVLWSLAIEEQFYLIAPWLVRLCGPARFLHLSITFIVTAILSRLLLAALLPLPSLAVHMIPFCRFDGFGFGFLAAWFVRQPSWKEQIACHYRLLILVWTTLAGGLVALSLARASAGGGALAYFGYTVIAAFCALSLVLLLNEKDSLIRRLFSSNIATGFGRYSYFIYLFQGTVIGLTLSIFHGKGLSLRPPQNWYEALTIPIACYITGWLSWKTLEGPLTRLGQSVRYKASEVAAA